MEMTDILMVELTIETELLASNTAELTERSGKIQF